MSAYARDAFYRHFPMALRGNTRKCPYIVSLAQRISVFPCDIQKRKTASVSPNNGSIWFAPTFGTQLYYALLPQLITYSTSNARWYKAMHTFMRYGLTVFSNADIIFAKFMWAPMYPEANFHFMGATWYIQYAFRWICMVIRIHDQKNGWFPFVFWSISLILKPT